MSCDRCGTLKLDYVDFEDQSKNHKCCVNCEHLELTQKEVINVCYYPSYTTGIKTTLQPIIPGAYKPENNIPIPKIFITQTAKPTLHNIAEQKELVIQEEQQNKDKVEVKDNTQPYIPKGKIKIDWSKVIGYEEIKHIISQALNTTHKKKTHVLIVGAAGTSKTVFLKTIEESLHKQKLNVHYLDSTTLSSSGVIEYLFTNDVQYCLLDEIDKLEKEHQRCFLNMLESGILQETKNKKIRKKDMKNTVFIATGNYIEKIMHPLLTRFLTLKIPEYTKQQFYEIGITLLTQQFGKSKEIAHYIVDNVYKIYKETRKEKPNLRYARDIATLTGNDKREIDPILKGITTYSQDYIE
jgi:Holliday junction resolvasome RuvABC ATP-dependent DNA helicase subunit